ncbi:hypothetical protein ACFXKW_18920 [Streptomyces sp. NPDC059193]|uniref:hypothetical protein n=1 Tax=Streptomyces sp. NPDC059193 TaxID=3346763 RepID=UPI00367F5C49
MIERRPLGTGPRPATPPAQPSAARRTRLAAEGAAEALAFQEPAAEYPAAGGRRPLGPGTDPAVN